MTNVRFTQDKKRIISIGGADHAIFQWRFMPDDSAPDAESVVGGGEKSEFKRSEAVADEVVPHRYEGIRK